MKLIHLSDLHIGKRVNEFSMLDDQKYIMERILEILKNEKPDGIIIAGDVYDKPVPPVEAVQVFDRFLTEVSALGIPLYIISGNHDSAERLSFGAELIRKGNIFISHPFDGVTEKYVLEDEFGKVNIYLMPFTKPIYARHFYEDENISTYTDAVKAVIDRMKVDTNERNVLVAHQFVTGAETCKSEEVSVGGLDNVDKEVFDVFDYTALGHIHGPQNVGKNIRYCGTPLKYSFSEQNHKKSVTVVEIAEKGNVKVSAIPLVPLRDMRDIKGKYDDIMFGAEKSEDYVRIILTDEDIIPDAISQLRLHFPNIMKLEYERNMAEEDYSELPETDVKQISPLEILEGFFFERKKTSMTAEQRKYAESIITGIWEDKQ